jgi:glycosyltransferase involved in cell wall biosynthesis
VRIAQVATLSTPVRRVGSDSVEGLVFALIEELMQLGHEVTVFAMEGSESSGELVATLPGRYGRNGAPGDWHVCEWMNMCAAVEQADRFDVIHAHAYLWSLPLTRLSRAAMVHTTHVMPYGDEAIAWAAVPEATVTAISRHQWSAMPRRPDDVVHHGIDVAQFPFVAAPDGYLCYLGRFTAGKDPLAAITAARAIDVPIVLAGPANEYFESQVRPLVDGRNVVYGGAVFGAERAHLLGRARALLYAPREPEPFGLVMAEAMMCGTPVAATAVGAVPEVIDAGVTGMIADGPGALADSAAAALALDRGVVRARAEERFTARRMAEQYLAVYRAAVREHARAAGGGCES